MKKIMKNKVIRKVVLATLLTLLLRPISAQEVLIDPSLKYQTIDGWGGSLCWWANIMGGYSDLDVLKVCDWITDPDGLNMNIFRFNIGGGDDPEHNHMRGDGGAMPGYKINAGDPYDWSQDENQRKILQQLIKSRVSQTGVNDILVEGFSNSPPWWMTRSGCSSGSTEGNVTNLKSDMFDDFADYLTEVVRYYHDNLDITFQTIEPFNEPFSTWWKALGGQEGCYFGQADQELMIRELYASLESKNMLGYCSITAMDSNTLDECYNGITSYKSKGDILPKISKINAHSYFGSDNSRKNLAGFSQLNNDFKLWQSESGPLSMSGSEEELMLAISQRIVEDIREMKCEAWIDWQLAADNSPVWGILIGKYIDPSHPVSKGNAYYFRSQFSRFIKQGYSVIDCKDENSLAALSPDQKELVVVIVNPAAIDFEHSYDLSAFQLSGPEILRYRSRKVNDSYFEKLSKTKITLEEKSLVYNAPAYSVSTFVIPVESVLANNLNGKYYIRNKAANQYVGIENASESQGASLVVTGSSAQNNSSFIIEPDLLNGGFTMKPGHLPTATNYVLDVQGVTNAERTKIMQYTNWGGENQRFHFVHMEDDFYKIIIRKSMKCWSIPDNIYTVGTPVLQMSWDGGDQSIWEIRQFPLSTEPGISKTDILTNYNTGVLSVRTSDDSMIKSLYIFNTLGSVIHSWSGNKNSEVLLNIRLNSGIYLLTATLEQGFQTRKLLIN